MRKMAGKKKDAQNSEDGENGVEDAQNDDADSSFDPLAENGGDEEADADKEKDDGDDDSDDEPLSSAPKGGKKGKKAAKKAEPKKKGAKGAKKKVSISAPENDDDEEEEEEYEVADIVDHKYQGKKLMYKIRWKGYTEDDDTWEPKDTLSCPDIIKKYEDANDVSAPAAGKKGGAKKRGRPSGGAKGPGKKAKKEEEENDEEGDEDDEGKEYEVQRILDVTIKKNGKREFLVHWKGWSSRFDTWEPEENLNCDDLITAFDAKLAKVKSSSLKELRIAPKATKRFVAANTVGGTRHSKRGGGKQRVTYFEEQ